MEWSFFSFFLNNEEAFLELNPNLLETNVFNILLLLGLLIYANKVSFSVGLNTRKNNIIQTIENAQKDLLNASNYYYFAEKGFVQSLFWLQSWKTFYQNKKINIVKVKYARVQYEVKKSFLTNQILIWNLKKKIFLSLKRYILLFSVGRILRKFLGLSEKKKSKFIQTTILKLGGTKK